MAGVYGVCPVPAVLDAYPYYLLSARGRGKAF